MGRLDTYIGNLGGVRLLGGGGRPSVPPLRRRRGKPGRCVREAAPYKRGGGRTMCAPTGEGAGTCPLIRLAYGQPPSPQGEGLGKTKRDRSGTCPLKPRGEAELRRKFLCLLSFSKKVRGPGSPPGPLTCVCCKGEGEMGDIDFFWVRSYHNRKIRRNRVRIMNFL